MNFRAASHLFTLRDLRNAVLGLVVVFGGIGLAGLTYYAHLTEQTRLAGTAAVASLVFVLLILIFVVPPLARNAGREASQMNLPFEFTAGGAVMLGLIAIVGFSAWNTGNNLLFLVLSFLSSAMIVGFIAGGICLKKLDVKMRFPETIFAGEETPILVTVTNRKRLFPSYSLVAEVRGREREESAAAAELRELLPPWIAERLSKPPIVRRTLDYFVHIPRRGELESRTLHAFDHRGRFLIKDFELSTKFPFGFFRHRRRLPARETELMVFPKPAPIDPHLDDAPLEIGRLLANKRGTGQDLLALRDYQPNDDLRRVDWKATARSRHLIVREFAAEDDKKVTIFLDIVVPREESQLSLREKIDREQHGKSVVISSRFEEGVSIAAGLLSHFTQEQADIRLIIAHEAGEWGIGTRHLHDSLKRLAVIDPQFTNGDEPRDLPVRLAEELDERDNTHNFVITTRPEDLIPSEITANSKIVRY